MPVPSGLVACRALLAYEGAARELVVRLKYRNARSSLTWLAKAMADLVQPRDGPIAVTWAPTTQRRRRTRGFDQAEVLARHVAGHLGLGCVALLTREPGPPQTGRSVLERRSGPQFCVRRSAVERVARLGRGAVVLVDDVITSGATMASAVAALREAGVEPVIGLAAAHTVSSSWSAPAT